MTDHRRKTTRGSAKYCYRLTDVEFASLSEQIEKALEWQEMADDARLAKEVERPVPCDHAQCALPDEGEWALSFHWRRKMEIGPWGGLVGAKIADKHPNRLFSIRLDTLTDDDTPITLWKDGTAVSYDTGGTSLLEYWSRIPEAVTQARHRAENGPEPDDLFR